jgi:hypothetical protein
MFFSILPTVVAGVTIGVVYTVGLVLYRLAFHPLAGFPGPWLAAATWWYEFYHDTRRGGGLYIWRIEELHKKYGMSFFNIPVTRRCSYIQRIVASC